MKVRNLKAVVVAMGVVGAVACGSPSARALSVVPFTFLSPNNGYTSGSVTVHLSYQNQDEYVWAGRYNAKVNNIAEEIFCTDFVHNIGPYNDSYNTLASLGDLTKSPSDILRALTGDNGKYYYQDASGHGGGLISALTSGDYHVTPPGLPLAARVNRVGYLSDTFLNSSTLTKQQFGGLQIAIWDIIQDGGDGLSAGDLRAGVNAGGSDGAQAIAWATTYLGLLGTGAYDNRTPSHSLWIQSPRDSSNPLGDHKQDFVYTRVPEPAYVQMAALLGLGGLGLLRSRRRRQLAAQS